MRASVEPHPPLKLIRHASSTAFLERVEPWLLQDEPEHSVVLSVAHALSGDDHPFGSPVFLASVEYEGTILGCALRPPPDGVTLTRMPSPAAEALARSVAEVYESLPDVAGPEREAEAFAERWSKEHGCDWTVESRVRWYAVEHVIEPAQRPAGVLRVAGASDLPWVTTWASDYAKEVWTAAVDVPAFFARRVRTGSLYVWENGEPRSMAAVSGSTPNTARISAVYTPASCRGHGYATAMTAAVTREVLGAGKRWCVLSADLANPTANSIYQRIGYRPTCDMAAIGFAPHGSPETVSD